MNSISKLSLNTSVVEYDSVDESFLLVYLGAFALLFYFLWQHRDRARYQNIPAAGFSGTFSSFISAIGWLCDHAGHLQKAYSKFPNGIFRYPTFTRWIVVVARPTFVEELRKAPENEVSASDAMNEILGLSHAIKSGLLADQELKSFLGAQLTRNLQELIHDVHPVITRFVSGLVLPEEDDWKYIDEADIATRMCNQVVNRVLVGASLGQNTDFVNQMAAITKSIEGYTRTLTKCPKFLRLFYFLLFTPLPRIKRKLRVLLANTLKERQGLLAASKDDFPNDMVTWFLGYDLKSHISVNHLLDHVLLVNYLATNPMAKMMIQALRNLARHPDYIKPLRIEAEEAIRSAGWTKSAVDKMCKVDSFLKETMRLDSSTLNPSFPKLTMARKCLRPLTFSDGTTVPPNTLLFVGSQLLHTDTRYYPKPEAFDPLRFSPPLVHSLSPGFLLSSSLDSCHYPTSGVSTFGPPTIPVSLTLPATSATFLGWGHGKHACPGRFFAASMMKLMLAQFLLEFDFRVPPIHQTIENQQSNKETDNILWIELRRCRHRLNPEI